MRQMIIKPVDEDDGSRKGGGSGDDTADRPLDEYDALAEQYEAGGQRGGRSGGGKKTRNPSSKTSKEARGTSVEQAVLARKRNAEKLIKKDLQRFPAEADSGKETIDKATGLYSSWVMASLQQGEPILDTESDLKYTQMRSKGAGGQNVNKVSSAVVCVHKISGVGARSEISRDMPENKAAALGRVYEKLGEHIRNWNIYLKGVDESERQAKIEELVRTYLGLEKFE